MSKTTKALAILGVVAGLGVASLPLSSYAAPITYKAPSTEGGNDGVGTLINGQKSVTSGVTNINLEIEDILQIDNKLDGETITLVNSGSTIAGIWTADNNKVLDLNVISNNPGGYTLTLKGAGTESHETSLVNAAEDEIISNVSGADANKSVWGYAVATDKGEDGKITAPSITGRTDLTGIEASGNNITTVSKFATPEAGDDYVFAFGADIVDGQASGTYTGAVTFTATNNAKAGNN